MNRIDQILMAEEFVKQNLKGYDSGHDWWHIERVRKLSLFINEMERLADPFLVEVTALLHDTADSKFADGNTEKGYLLISEFMEKAGLSEFREQVLHVIKNISFSNKNKHGNADDPLLWVIQDADRLDAIGAIGIARAFNYGGFRNNAIYIPDEVSLGNSRSTIGHFYDKLLRLKEMMNTPTGRRLAEERHDYLEKYLEQFFCEWRFCI
jgi:uncharacterized protein